MNLIFLFAFLIILTTVPFWFVIILLTFLKLFFNFKFTISGLYHITDIGFEFSNDEFSFSLKIDSIKVIFGWPRTRFSIEGLKTTFNINKLDFKENNDIYANKRINDISFIKEKFAEILKSKMWTNNKDKNNLLSFGEINYIDDIVKHKKTSFKNRFVLYVLRFFDIYIEKIKATLKFTKRHIFYSIRIRKIITGVIKSPNKKSQIDIVGGLYDLEIREHIGKLAENLNIEDKKEAIRSKYKYKHYVSKNIYINKYKKKDTIKYRLIKLSNVAFKMAFINGFFPPTKTYTIMNKVSISIEGSDLIANISKRSVDNIISLIIGVIVSINNNKENKSMFQKNIKINRASEDVSSLIKENNNYNEITCIEQVLVKKVDSELKKIEIKIQNIKINVYNDNYIYKYLTLYCSNLKIERNSTLYLGNNINNDLHLIKREMELHFTEIKVFQFKNKQLYPVTEVPLFDLSIKDNIIYHSITQTASLSTNISGKLSNIEMILTTKNVNRIIELVLTIVDGIDIIEYVIKAKKKYKYRIDKELKDTTLIDIDISNLNAYIYSSDYYLNICEVATKISMENIKGISKLMTLDFPHLNLNFSPNLKDPLLTNYMTSNIIIDGFKIVIDDKKANGGERWYNLYFTDTLIVTTDRYILYMLKFVSEIADFILRDEVDKKLKKRTGKYGVTLKKIAKKGTKFVWNKIELVTIFHEYDIVHAFFEDFNFILDELLIIPKVYMYHITTLERTNLFRKFIDIDNFSMKYFTPTDFILTCDDFRINYYETYMARPIAHMILFFVFFPDWMEYYITYKFELDEDTQLEKYEITRDKVVQRKVKITKLHFDINDNPVTSAAIFQAKREELDQNLNSIISYLKKIKADLLTLIMNGIDIDMVTTIKVMRNLNNNKNDFDFYNRILINSKVEVNIPETKVNLEGEEIITLGNLYYKYANKKNFYDFNPNEILTQLILYDRFVMIRKKIAFESKLENEIILKSDNNIFKFKDTIVFDKTLTFIMKTINTIREIPVKNCQTTLLSDKVPQHLNKTLFASLTGLNGTISSFDQKKNEIYNTLIIQFKEISYLKETEMEKLKKLKDRFQLSVYYFLFGFSPIQKSGFPLFFLPLCEVNEDSVENVMHINFPTDIPSEENGYTAAFTEIYNKELNDLVIKTKSLTIFLNYQYLEIFYKIFDIFWKKTSQLRKGNKKTDTNNKKYRERESFSYSSSRRSSRLNTTWSMKKFSPLARKSNKKLRYNIKSKESKKKQIIKLALFDLKIIYLLEYKDDYKNIFSFHKFVEEHKYFGYIFRFYSFNLAYNNNQEKEIENEIKAKLQFLTISFLDVDNLSDEPFFKKDSELKNISFNLKNIDNFNTFMGLNKENKSKLLNHHLDEYMIRNGYKQRRRFSLIQPEIEDDDDIDNEFIDLTFDFRHIFIKISEFDVMKRKNPITGEQTFKLSLTNCKIAWNKFNKDVFTLIIFKDSFLIIDKILLKIKKSDKDKDKEKETKGEDSDRKLTKKKSKNIETNSNQIKEQSKEFSNTSKEKILPINNEEELEYGDEEGEEIEDEENNNLKPKTSLNFEINNPQIVVQNEIKGSALLLICRQPLRLTFNNYFFNNDKKNYKLSIICTELSLYSVLKSDQKDSAIYWMGKPDENKYHLKEEDFEKIITAPRLDFELAQNVISESETNLENTNPFTYINKKEKIESSILDKSNSKTVKDNYDIKTETSIVIDKITGNFNSVYFNDFMNIISVLIFDRGFSFSQEKKADNQIKEDIKKFKESDIKNKLKEILSKNKISEKKKNHVKFELKEVSFKLFEDIDKLNEKKKKITKLKNKSSSMYSNFNPLLEFQMNDFEGNHIIRDDKSSETHIWVSKLLIKNVEHEMSQPVFQQLFNPNHKDLENKLKIITFMKKDRYTKLETGSIWYILDEFDFNISPFSFHISKKQIIFILDFFFHNDKNEWDEDKKKKEGEDNKKKEEEYPTYFRQFKIDEIKCFLNFEYSPEASVFNVPLTKLKMRDFVKYDKFYTLGTMINRFVGHCKQELIKNFPNILSSIFSNKNYSYEHQENKEKDAEAAKRKLLFGDK